MCRSFCLSTCQIWKSLQLADSQDGKGRDMAYDCWFCELFCAASSPDLYRTNLEQIKRKLPKGNRLLAARLLENEEAENEKKDEDAADAKKTSKKKKGLRSDDLKDERFAVMFENKDFEVDEFSPEYLALHPKASKKQPSLVEKHFEPVMEDEDQNLSDSDASPASSSSEHDHTDDKRKSKNKSRVPRLYEVKDRRHAEAFWNRVHLQRRTLFHWVEG